MALRYLKSIENKLTQNIKKKAVETKDLVRISCLIDENNQLISIFVVSIKNTKIH
jgi:hypothetical protein